MAKRPLHVIITWDDAADRNVTCEWDGTFETAARIPEIVHPYLGREASGFLGFINEAWVYIASDWDAADQEMGKWAVIPLGWVSKITTANGRVLFSQTPVTRDTNVRKRGSKV